MVAVTTTSPSRPARRPRGGHLALVLAPSSLHGGGRCGCHLEGALVAAPVLRVGAGRRPSTAVYRRRRLVAALVVALLALATWAALAALGGALTASGRSTSGMGTPVAVEVVEVAPGDTFWTIALRLQPEGDVRPLVDRLVRAHGGATLQVGERIALPAAA